MGTSPIRQTRIDWRRPWFGPFSSLGKSISQSADWRVAATNYASAIGLVNHRGFPVTFIPQESLEQPVEYEAFISATGNVPTRDNLHDFFNALVWLTFPKIKARLNELQAIQLSSRTGNSTSRGSRGVTRDAATVFDENAALWITADAHLTSSLRQHDWITLFQTNRESFGRKCSVIVFGHALLEKLVCPYKAITAHTWNVALPGGFQLESDGALLLRTDNHVSQSLSQRLTTREFLHLPILGVPNWWEGQSDEFYSDSNVFRPCKYRDI